MTEKSKSDREVFKKMLMTFKPRQLQRERENLVDTISRILREPIRDEHLEVVTTFLNYVLFIDKLLQKKSEESYVDPTTGAICQ